MEEIAGQARNDGKDAASIEKVAQQQAKRQQLKAAIVLGIRLVVSHRKKQPEEALRQWQPLFERSEFAGCHSKAFGGCPARNAAGEFFLCERFFFAEKKKCGKKFGNPKYHYVICVT